MIPPPMTTYDFYSASTTAAVDNFIYTGSPTTTNPLTTTSDWRLRWHMEHGGGVMAFPTFPPFNEQNKQDVGFYMILTDLPEVLVAFMTILLNLYCLLSIYMIGELQAMQFYLVGFQSAYDFLFSGLSGLFFYFYQARTDLANMCFAQEYVSFTNYGPEYSVMSNPYSTFCDTALVQKLLPVSDWSNEERLLENYFKYFNETMEVFPFYCQCFLMVGMSFERWVIVCKPHSVKQILSRKNKIIYYSLISLCAVIVPSCVVGDYILNMRFDNTYDTVCDECWLQWNVYSKRIIEFAFFIAAGILAGFFYFNIIQTLRNVRQTTANRKLTKAFGFLYLSWICCVLPHLIFDSYLLYDMESNDSHWGSDVRRYFEDLAISTKQWNTKYHSFTVLSPALMALKHAYGFINSVLLIVMLRAFQEPAKMIQRYLKALFCGRAAKDQNIETMEKS
ncbi:uncharacterized protein LOC134856277 [Symsagittifera roscoffensis]|uniref:uncharacterized protein LOC134856277 n=1 Tax=Symsagittifera roscoffensis TaxID=84072 RepID=UPI00307BBEE4